jgi:hypothetical protein
MIGAGSALKHNVFFLGIKKLKGRGIIFTAAKHNLRETHDERGADSHIDPMRTKDNYIISGESTADGVAAHERALLAEAEFPHALRTDTVYGIELVASLPTDSQIDHREYFAEFYEWARVRFECPILSAVVHMDERAKHCHIVILPLFNGRMIGGRAVGDYTKFTATITDFYERVAKPHGLARQEPQKRLSASVRHEVAGCVFAEIKRRHDVLNEPAIKDALLALIAVNPAPIAEVLGIDLPKPTKQAKPAKSKDLAVKKSKDFEMNAAPEKDRSLSCEDFGSSAPPVSPADRLQSIQHEYVREREEDHAADYWDEVQGKFIKPPTK